MSETFGHEPTIQIMDGRGLGKACARCRTRTKPTYFEVEGQAYAIRGVLPVRWPCTSAIVLGLAPREAGTP